MVTTLFKDINPGVSDGEPYYLTVCDGLLYFWANDGTHGYELWVSDGTADGTVLVKDINAGAVNSNIRCLTAYNDLLYFRADDGTNGTELWVSDGTADGTTQVKDINVGGSSSPDFLTVYNGLLYFGANDGVNGEELWVSDGTAAGTTLVDDLVAGGGSSYPYSLTVYDGNLYFRGGINKDQVFFYDGTVISEVSALAADETIQPRWLFAADSRLYIVAYSETYGRELVAYDGTTVELIDYYVGDNDGLYLD